MKNFVKDTFLYIIDYIRTTDIFLILMSVGASILSFTLMLLRTKVIIVNVTATRQ